MVILSKNHPQMSLKNKTEQKMNKMSVQEIYVTKYMYKYL